MKYSELHCVSNYSFLRGASHPHELVAEAARLGYQSIAITDECSFSSVVKAWLESKKHSIKLIIGSEFLVEINGSEFNHESVYESDSYQIKLVLLARNKKGYQQISKLISDARRRSKKGEYSLSIDDLSNELRACIAIIKILPNTSLAQVKVLKKNIESKLWLGVSFLQDGHDEIIYQQAKDISNNLSIPIVACGNVHMHIEERKRLQDLITAIRLNKSIQNTSGNLFKNAQNHLRNLVVIEQLYPSELIEQTQKIDQLCNFDLSELRYDYPKELAPSGENPASYLRRLSYQGASVRWPKGIPSHVETLLEKELTIIKELAYEYYFLTVYDIVYFARNNNILCQGRGSAANSVVCYCLMITEVDPARSELLFERFISKERNEPPDIDVDFENERREEVIQYIYNKYSRNRAALAATVITYRPKSAIRDVGKALDLDPCLIEKLASSTAWWDSRRELVKRFSEVKVDNHNYIAKLFLDLIDQLIGFPRHLSQHVGGFIITQSPISNLVPLENAAMPDRTIIQWDKYDIEAMGLLKVDVLALGMLTAIRKSINLINSYMEIPISLADIPVGDPKTYSMLCRGDSIGVFQVESRAQMSMLPRLKPKSFYDLVIQVAIVRPGPIQGDMVHPFLKRRDGIEKFDYPNEEVKKVLQRTLGVPIFQEQVIKLAMVAAGFSGGEADRLRRAMAAWKRTGELEQFRDKLINGMLERGHSLDFAKRLFKQIQGFGEYGFPESHAASFALIVYSSAWLKCHYPAAFYCGLLNSQPMGFYSPSQLVQDAKRRGVKVLEIDIRYSFWDSSLEHKAIVSPVLEHQPKIRLGMHLIKGLSKNSGLNIVNARHEKFFSNLQDLACRAKLNKSEIEAIIAANACKYLTQNRHQGLWQAAAIEETKPLLNSYENSSKNLLSDTVKMAAPTVQEDMLADYSSTGLTLAQHPLALLRKQSPFNRCKQSADLNSLNHSCFISVAGVVTCRQRPATATGVLFLTLEDETGNINVIVWKSLQQKFRQALLNSRLLLVKGKMEKKNSVVHVIAGYIEDVSEQLESFKQTSRDFH